MLRHHYLYPVIEPSAVCAIFLLLYLLSYLLPVYMSDRTRLVISHRLSSLTAASAQTNAKIRFTAKTFPSPPHSQGTWVELECSSLSAQSLSQDPGKSSFHSLRWKFHYRSARPLFEHKADNKKRQKRQRWSFHLPKAYWKPPGRAVTMIASSTSLSLFFHYALCPTPCSFSMPLLLHPSVVSHPLHS